MDNLEIASMFRELADLLELKGENPFKVRAYMRAADIIESLPENAATVAAEGRLKHIEGIGEAIEKKTAEIATTGRLRLLDDLRREVPPGLRQLLRIPGVGPRTAMAVFRHLGIATLEELERAARDGRLKGVPGIGAKSAENILRAIERLREDHWTQIPLGTALAMARLVLDRVVSVDGVYDAAVAGSVRRWRETCGDLDIVVAAEKAGAVMEAMGTWHEVSRTLSAGDERGSFATRSGPDVDLWVVPPSDFAAALHHATGSKAHNVRLRGIARRRGLTVNEHGVFSDDGVMLPVTCEEDIYAALGLAFVPPELREDAGEIEAALEGRLPDLIRERDILGDLHVHSDWSDGASSIAAMAEAAKARGYEYIAICDHSQSLGIAGGLTADEVLRQVEFIADLGRHLRGITVLSGIEVDIKKDGTLDLPDEVLARLDIVVASVHSSFKQPREAMTDRIIRAMRNPNVDVIGHPTGRVLGRRDGYEVDVQELISEAARSGVALEINAFPDRLDLDSGWARKARDAGAVLAVNTDSHSFDQLGYMVFGVGVARRGWLERSHVVNAWPLARLREWLSRRQRQEP
ncbi:MAG: DNA polymerase/3'-5' exonuclease PolX [Firmicutes bacterium]|jgi:DNA polymerase (family 10)|nr:DNA polymerase/3'-5' exonuclease PolX [Bacillota bacterium]MDH7496087.1 DNA polymerase/3'-5' exonuclease PolX [Bacillota bacterium]